MSTPREVRRLAFQALYQFDARADEPAEAIQASLAESDGDAETFTPSERRKAIALASNAFAARASADEFMAAAAPEWPVHRQAAVDRAILRLAYYEMMETPTHPKIVVNEAIELAKAFSTEKSPAFVNGLLDKALKVALRNRGEAPPQEPAAAPGEPAAPAEPSAT